MKPFEALHAWRDFEKENLPFLKTAEDRDILHQIGLHPEGGRPLTLQELFALGIGSVATVQRRLAALKAAGAVEQVPLPRDRRSLQLLLTPMVRKLFFQYHELLRGGGGKRSPRRAK